MDYRTPVLVAGAILVLLAIGLGNGLVAARGSGTPVMRASPLHPTFALLDSGGENVLASGDAVSTMLTCGQCHDTDFIAAHSYHTSLGGYGVFPDEATGRPWDATPGFVGQWDPLAYRYLSWDGDELFNMGLPEWVLLNSNRHVGGGPAMATALGGSLLDQPPDPDNPDTAILDSETGRSLAWDWSESGVIEMNCFLCHLESPNNAARIAAIQEGDFGWANTATLEGTGLITRPASGAYLWNSTAFDADGELLPQYVTIQDPTNANCAQCHGLVHTDAAPLTLSACNDLDNPQTALTGQVISAQRISESGVNLSDKGVITRSWDIHAERQVECTDCHFSLNNPVYYQGSTATLPEGLLFDPRRLEIGEYLQRPDHNFARGQGALFNLDPALEGTMRRCASCHDAVATHNDWLPYTERHMDVVACESCHVPQMYAPALQSVDWTVLTIAGGPRVDCRGTEGLGTSTAQLVSGYQPVLLPRQGVGDEVLLAPYNVVTVWFWVSDNPSTRPVRRMDLEAAWFMEDGYPIEVLAAFDANDDGSLNQSELVIDTPEKQVVIAARLEALGLQNPRIIGEIYPYSINHNVASGAWAINDCETCHTAGSRLTQAIQLAAYTPAGVTPEFISDGHAVTAGVVYVDDDGRLYFQPDSGERYVFGQDRVGWVDWFGGLLFLGALAAIAGHSGMRVWGARRTGKRAASEINRIYMYQAYERLWHWLQTIVIVLLLFTGLIIHRPDMFGIFSFRGMVTTHNVLAVLLALNAFLSLFYHLASGEIKQFLPRPRGFFDDAIIQARYYLQGIFKHEAHPFEKTAQRKMNPLQQATYFAILNVLLPLQGLTGILMWGVQRWPQLAAALGGLPFLAPFHSLVAWMFAAFIAAHVYLTTTGGSKPLDSIKAMVTGWEDIELTETKKPPQKSKKEKR